ncbi:DUF4389 domain-containing protein [Porticoccaceae bacterium LTM1]|nr:DUF4389 domain-containing protein [Porticoccaceae bacterium LTM1]
MTDKPVKTNLLNVNVWIRLIYMVIFGLLMMLARAVIWVVVALQFILVLVTGKDNDNLRNLGQGLGKWVYQGVLFLSFNSEEKPYPFSDWPDIEATESYEAPVEEASEEASNPVVATEQPSDNPDAGGDEDVPSFTEAAEEEKGKDTPSQ